MHHLQAEVQVPAEVPVEVPVPVQILALALIQVEVLVEVQVEVLVQVLVQVLVLVLVLVLVQCVVGVEVRAVFWIPVCSVLVLSGVCSRSFVVLSSFGTLNHSKPASMSQAEFDACRHIPRPSIHVATSDLPFDGMSRAAIQKKLGINPVDRSSVQLVDRSLGHFVVPVIPVVSNMVLVAAPAKEADDRGIDIDLTGVALQNLCAGGGMQLNQRRFAAVKYTAGRSADSHMERAGLISGLNETMCRPNESVSSEPSPCYDFLRHRWLDKTRSAAVERRDKRVCSESWNRVTVLCFATARLVCTGSKSGWHAVSHALKLTRDMRSVTPNLPNPRCELQNIVSAVVLYAAFDDRTTDLDGSLCYSEAVLNGDVSAVGKEGVAGTRKRRRTNSGAAEGDEDAPGLPLAEIAEEIGLQANFNRALFPGLIVRQHGVCFLVFRRSACVVTGAKCVRQMTRAYCAFLWSFTVYTIRVFERNAKFRALMAKIPKYLRILVREQRALGTLDPMAPPFAIN